MDDSGIFGNVLGQVGNIAKTTGQQIVKVPEEMAKEAKDQIVGEKQEKRQWKSDEERRRYLKDLYGSAKPGTVQNPADKNSSEAKKNDLQSPQNKKPTEFEKQIADKSPEEQKRLLEARQELHKEVYSDPTFNPPQKQEERPAEKVESEKKEDRLELEKKEEKKPPPLVVVRQQNKAEMFRGVSG